MNIDQAIEKLIPILADRVAAQWRRQYDSLFKEFGPSFKGVYRSESASVWSDTIKPLTSTIGDSCKSCEYKLNDAKVAAAAQAYAEAAAAEWREKITGKLGDVEYREFKLFGGCNFLVHATHDGHDIRLDQDVIFKQSTRGLLFNQFPSRIYVDGKFVSEKQYKEMW